MKSKVQSTIIAPPFLSKTERRRFVGAFLTAVLLILAASFVSRGAELKPETLQAWDAYVQAQNARVAQYSSTQAFLWSDQSPDRLQRVHKGETVVAPVGENPHRVPQGLIHHWVGAAFFPGIHLEEVLAVVRDYSRYKEFYAPNVIDSRVSHRAEADDTFSLRLLNQAVVSKFALDTEFHNTFRSLDENKWYGISQTTRVREVENYGQATEHEAGANTGRGLIWRLYSISRFEQRDGGVYVELEAVALSRDVPGVLRWVIDPAIRRTSRDSLRISLQKTEGAILETSRLARGDDRQNIPIKSAFSIHRQTDQVANRLMH